MFKKELRYLWLGTIALTLSYACQKNTTIKPEVENELTVEISDTIKVHASTYLLDSLPTSNMGSILLGKVSDAEFGEISASSYFQLKPTFVKEAAIPENARFDSLNLVLKYNKYTYGDTAQNQEIVVEEVVQPITLRKLKVGVEQEELPVFLKEDALYSSSSFATHPVPLGTRFFKARPNTKDSISIRLSPALGAELFKKIINKDKELFDADEFIKYFKGIKLSVKNGASINGFETSATEMVLNYTSIANNGIPKKGNLKFNLNKDQYQFNHIDSDRSQTQLKEISYSKRELEAASTQQQVYLQGGVGLVTKITIPGLDRFLKEPNIVVNKFELIIKTTPQSYEKFTPPKSLILFIANAAKVPKAVINVPFTQETQKAPFEIGNEAGGSGKYVFQLVEYANAIKKGTHVNTSLLLSLPTEELSKSVSRLLIKNKQNTLSISTQITYTKYK